MKILFALIFSITGKHLLASDTAIFSCKYRYTWQKDSSNSFSKFNDIMILSKYRDSTVYYSYLKQFGNRQIEEDFKKQANNISGNNVSLNSKAGNNYFVTNESEIIVINNRKKTLNITDRFIENAYKYFEMLEVPNWQIGFGRDTILGRICQVATTNFKGRDYKAWFTNSIPISAGPWLFNGLPGLILKVTDSKEQFLFECIELNTKSNTTKVYKPYPNTIAITKRKLQSLKKLWIQNPLEFMQAEEGSTITVNGRAPVKRPNKPYNPIDLTQ